MSSVTQKGDLDLGASLCDAHYAILYFQCDIDMKPSLCLCVGELKREGKKRESEMIIAPRIHRRQLMES